MSQKCQTRTPTKASQMPLIGRGRGRSPRGTDVGGRPNRSIPLGDRNPRRKLPCQYYGGVLWVASAWNGGSPPFSQLMWSATADSWASTKRPHTSSSRAIFVRSSNPKSPNTAGGWLKTPATACWRSSAVSWMRCVALSKFNAVWPRAMPKCFRINGLSFASASTWATLSLKKMTFMAMA